MARRAKAGEPTDQMTRANRNVMRAVVFGGSESVKKRMVKVRKEDVEGASAALESAADNGILVKHNLIEVPYDKLVLAQLPENNTELGQCIAAMEINIEGFGGRLVPTQLNEEVKVDTEAKLEAERKELRKLIMLPNPDYDFTMLRRRTRVDMESTGEAYWELVPQRGDVTKIAAINHVESHTILMKPQDNEFTTIKKRMIDPETGDVVEKEFLKRFRRFVQKRNGKVVYFKEWGDPRVIDRRNGKAYKDLADAKAKDETFKPQFAATALYHFKIYSPRTPYGLPRFIGNLFSIFGSRAADEVNWNTFQNNNVPSMIIAVSGNAMLTEGTIKRVEEFTQYVTKRDTNYSKFLLLEAEPMESGTLNSGTAKIDVTPLVNNQHKDQLFQEYDKNNADKVRRAFRLPPIFVGRSDDYSRATAESSRRLADEQVFAPERREMDRRITELFRDMGYVFWEYKSFGPNVTDDDDLVRILSSTEKTGALTPNLSRKVLGDILSQDIPPYKEEEVGFNPDVPFSLTMADAVKGIGALGGNPSTGALAPNQGQVPGVPKEVSAAFRKRRPTAQDAELVNSWMQRLEKYAKGEVPEDEPVPARKGETKK